MFVYIDATNFMYSSTSGQLLTPKPGGFTNTHGMKREAQQGFALIRATNVVLRPHLHYIVSAKVDTHVTARVNVGCQYLNFLLS